MPKKLFITIGALSIILLLAAWLYLFLFGTPSDLKQTWNNLSSPATPVEQPIVTTQTDAVVDIRNKSLSQLTTRPVAGFVVIEINDEILVRYVEKGTGHIYEINLANGIEERRDGTTLANTVEAYFNPEGTVVVLVTIKGPNRAVKLRDLADASYSALPPNSHDFTWTGNETLHYTDRTADGTIAYKKTGGTEELWRTPLTDIRVFFTADQSWLVNKPAASLLSSLYEVRKNSLINVAGPGYAMTGLPDPTGQYILYRHFDQKNKTSVSKIKDTKTGEETIIPLSAIPEKCVFSAGQSRVWCASSFMFFSPDRGYLNAWYRGEVTSADKLWSTEYGTWKIASTETDLSSEAGFDVDVINLTVSNDGNWLFFCNKINDALWVYRVNEPTPILEEPGANEIIEAATTTGAS